jgi:hypothetical protein
MIESAGQPAPTVTASVITAVGPQTGLSYVVLGEWMAVVGFVAVCLSIIVNLRTIFRNREK